MTGNLTQTQQKKPQIPGGWIMLNISPDNRSITTHTPLSLVFDATAASPGAHTKNISHSSPHRQMLHHQLASCRTNSLISNMIFSLKWCETEKEETQMIELNWVILGIFFACNNESINNIDMITWRGVEDILKALKTRFLMAKWANDPTVFPQILTRIVAQKDVTSP